MTATGKRSGAVEDRVPENNEPFADDFTPEENGNTDSALVPAGGNVKVALWDEPEDMEPIAVAHLLNQYSMDELMTLDPFYVTNIQEEESTGTDKRGVERNGRTVCYVFELIDADTGEFIGSSKTATVGIIAQLDSFMQQAISRGASPDAARLRRYGPVSAGKPEKRDGGTSKSVKFIPPVNRTRATASK